MPIYLYTLINNDEYYDIDLNDLQPMNKDKSCFDIFLSQISKSKNKLQSYNYKRLKNYRNWITEFV
jgi:hypothetical protein